MNLSVAKKRTLIDKDDESLSISMQCMLLGMSRSSYYHTAASESLLNLTLMNHIDEVFTKRPFYGTRKLVHSLGQLGYEVNRKRISRLMRVMGLEPIYPKKNLSKRHPGHRIYPYLLRNVNIERPNHVWSTDITYVRLQGGFAYLVAVIDWYSRYVLSWELSNSLDQSFCLQALNDSLSQGVPEIFNTDQGVQFTSDDFTGTLENKGIKISMDGRGRALDNIFVERLWRSVKYEDIHIKGYSTMSEAYEGLNTYFEFYNSERFHQSLDYRTPGAVYNGVPLEESVSV